MVDEIDLKILESLGKRSGNSTYASPRAITNAIGPIPYHGLIKRLQDLEDDGLVLNNNCGGEWRIEDLGREMLKSRETDSTYPYSNVK